MILMISYFYVKNTYEDFDIQMEKFVHEYYENQKRMLKKEIDIDAVFKQAESLIESQAIATKDKNWVRAISIPISRVIRARAVYEKRQADGDNSVVSVEDDALCTDYDHDGTCVD
mgnify:CR=1 FL=1